MRNHKKTSQILGTIYITVRTICITEQFVSQLEPHMYKIRPNTIQLLKYTNEDIKESANINPVPSKILPLLNSAMSF